MAATTKITGWSTELQFFLQLGVVPDDAYHEVHEYYWHTTPEEAEIYSVLYAEWRQHQGLEPAELRRSAAHLHQVVQLEPAHA